MSECLQELYKVSMHIHILENATRMEATFGQQSVKCLLIFNANERMVKSTGKTILQEGNGVHHQLVGD